MKPSANKCLSATIGMIAILVTSAFGLEPQDPSIINLNTAVHFLTPDGNNVLLRSGNYKIQPTEGGLRFIPESGAPQVVEAENTTHEEDLNSPLAISLPGEEKDFRDMHLVMLLLPGGQSLETEGSYSGVRERGSRRTRISSFKKRYRSKVKRITRRYRANRVSRPAGGRLKVRSQHLSGIWIYEESVSKWKKAQKFEGRWIWPGVYDVSPKTINMRWALNLGSSAIPKVVGKQGYGFEVRLNGRLLKQGSKANSEDFYAYPANYDVPEGGVIEPCPKAMECLDTSIRYLQWENTSAPWSIEISYWKIPRKAIALGKSYLHLPGSKEPLVKDKAPKKTKVSGIIYPNGSTGMSYFTNMVYPIFQHERCISCHALGSKATLAARHDGLLSEKDIHEVQGNLGMNLGCMSGCHGFVPETIQPVDGVQFHDTEWKTPRFDMGIDWRGKSQHYVCQTVKSKLPTADMQRAHFFHDSRIAWAVHSGKLPFQRPDLPVAPPGSYSKFQNLIELWIRSGSPCP